MGGPILCGVDGSEGGWRALDHACAQARARKARLVFACVVPSGDFPEEMEEFARIEHAAEHAGALLFEMVAGGVLELARERAERAGVSDAEYLARRGEAADELCALARQRKAEEIVVGRRRRWAALALLGSVSARLAAEAPCPVTIAPI
jgi:nucleotide-binding universal stress UspA family protein